MTALLKSNPCRNCRVNFCRHNCEDKEMWTQNSKKGIYPIAANFRGRAIQ